MRARIPLVVLGFLGSVIAAPPLVTPLARADGETLVAMTGKVRRCDFSAINFYSGGNGRATALIGVTAADITAEVRLLTAQPRTRYTARLIQMPRPTLTCGGAAPGVTSGTLETDDFGAGSLMLRGDRAPGATGAWVILDRPAERSQVPAESYCSDFVVAI